MRGSVKKRATWGYVVDIGRDPFTGKRKQKSQDGFKREKDAQAALNKVLYEIDVQGYIEPSKEIFLLLLKVGLHLTMKNGLKKPRQLIFDL